jgi:biopolymer transport protein ExbD
MKIKHPSQNNSEIDQDINAEINMTPLIDIMLVLLIIFMVTSSISFDSGMDINLPQAQQQTSLENASESAVIISVGKDGSISIQGEKTSPENVKDVLKNYLVKEKTQTVILEGDRDSTLGKTVNLMDIAKSVGAEKFSIATESTSGI